MEKTKVKAAIQQTNCFIYKSKEYPFNLHIVSEFSPEIAKNKKQFEKFPKIPLIHNEEEINLSEKTIKDFINYCHGQSIEIDNENVLELNYLSKEYEIDSLLDTTNQYIIDNDQLLLKVYLFNINKQDNQVYEDAISERLNEFIDNEDLIKLPITSLHRILQKNQNVNIDEKFNFLFKCLDKYGRSASVLFENADFGEDQKKYLIKLLCPQYSNIIDFRFINPQFIISLYQQHDSIIRYEEERRLEINDLKIIINEQKDKIEELQQKVTQQEQDFEIFKKKQKLQNIRALYLISSKETPDRPQASPINIDFIRLLNTKDVRINVDSFNENKIMEVIKLNENFLDSYDVLIFGNGDGGGRFIKLDYTFFDLVESFNNKGGAVLLLHDFNVGKWKNKDGKPYDFLKKHLNYKENTKSPLFMFTRVKFDEQKCGDLMSFPYKLDPEFDVAETHETPMYEKQYQIIGSKEKPEYHYYSENSEKRVADISMGHNNQITPNEKKLLFNIICHLSQL